MMEGKLYASRTRGCYAIGHTNGPNLLRGHAVEVLLGGQWIAGRVEYSRGRASLPAESTEETIQQSIGAYHLSREETSDPVTEASEESFPASDAPAWPTSHDTAPSTRQGNRVVNGYYFVADADGSVCGLCIGMQVRTGKTSS
jgi:hypothetical protein